MKFTPQRRSVLLASIGTSPGVLTNAVWALAHQKRPVVHNTRTLVQLAVSSPGPLPKGMTVALLKRRHRSIPVNPLLAQGMYLRGYIEHVGSGTGDIIARCREWGLPDPKWQVEDGEDFVMVMPRPQSSVKSSVRTVDWSVDKSVDWSVDKTCDQVLSILKTNPRATLDQVANVVGLSVRGIEQAIKRLKKAKRIRKVGGKRFGHWEVLA